MAPLRHGVRVLWKALCCLLSPLENHSVAIGVHLELGQRVRQATKAKKKLLLFKHIEDPSSLLLGL